jgi:membrane protease YdiL (CAAX protease family)
MSTLAPTLQPTSSPRRLIARHPVAAFLVMVYTVTITFALLRTRGDIPLPFDLSLWMSLEHLFDCALPAFVVVAALKGRAGVRDLMRRSFKWRVAIRWYLVALLGLPVATVLCAGAIFRLAPLQTLGANWPLLWLVLLPDLLMRIVFFNLAEEIGWTGFLQDRLQTQYGPLKACVLTEIPFALFHVPDVLVDTGGQLAPALIFLIAITIVQLFGRVVIMWLYNRTNHSVLLVALFHSTYNTSVNRLAPAFIPEPAETGFLIVSGLVAVAAVLLVFFTRGRLAYQPNEPQA